MGEQAGTREGRRPSLYRRLAWTAAIGPQRPVPSDRSIMARTFAYLFGLGVVLLLVTLPLPHDPDREILPMLLAGAVAAATAILFVVGFDRLPMWVFHFAPALGTVLIAIVVYAAGPGAGVAYAFFLFWVVLSAAYFFELRVAVVHIAFAAACYGAVLLVRDPTPTPLLYWTMVLGTLAVGGVVMVGLRYQLDTLVTRLESAARTDPLTRLANRREFSDRLDYELARAIRMRRPLGVITLDLDGFKLVNDRFGHDAGDRALEHFAELLRRTTRRIDTIARTGGEEFTIVAPEAAKPDGRTLAERVRMEVEASFARRSEELTVSCGVAAFPDSGRTAEDLLRAADRALYAAKAGGRNATVVHDPVLHGPGLATPESGDRGSGGPQGPPRLRRAEADT